MQAPVEHEFTCPYCWERITMVLEPAPQEQVYVEDCEVCCNPIQIRFRGEGHLEEFQAEPLGQ
ncbi:MAG: CPXCG motif-containing cysteine-rich protein [Rhodothermales bacterium]|nr:CPXCG motif-containing cysteine-rich protein [Rhodothermales bacterium]